MCSNIQSKPVIFDKFDDVVFYFNPAMADINDIYEKLINIAKDSGTKSIFEDVSRVSHFSILCLFDDFVIDILLERVDYGYEVKALPCYKSGLGEVKEFCNHKISMPPIDYLMRIKDKIREINDKIYSQLNVLHVKKYPN